MQKTKTIGELRASGYRSRTIKEEIRDNLVNRLRSGQETFPGIVGYGDTVIPQLENALLSGHDILLVGQRGQGKTRIMRSLVGLMDPWVPAMKGCQIHDDPLHPICRPCREVIRRRGDEAEIIWVPQDVRYVEKLATPDVTPADIIGDVDPIKIAEGRYLSDEETIHFGLAPRAHRGIFAINELPELHEKIQVGLFNVLEERDIQIRGFQVRLPLDVLVVATCNPEDYTNRGRIVTPLKDRFGSQIRTHYPPTLEDEIRIMEAESKLPTVKGTKLVMPDFMKQVVAGISMEARSHPEINQNSGVSVRMTIDNYENVASQALKRSLINNEPQATPRISDLAFTSSSSMGKIEFDCLEPERDHQVMQQVVDAVVRRVFLQYFQVEPFHEFISSLDENIVIEVSERSSAREIVENLRRSGLPLDAVRARADGSSESVLASVLELVLEGLHQEGFLGKRVSGPAVLFRKREAARSITPAEGTLA
ncbi:MAG: AAA family ATPase [Deltaproteobacteria bacterium]|nr:AAA family ATPase [Deltaproteobacteria bacterium]